MNSYAQCGIKGFTNLVSPNLIKINSYVQTVSKIFGSRKYSVINTDPISCYGFEQYNPSVCKIILIKGNGFGKCIQNDTCACDFGFFGI
jgi:hypothetical protein